MLRLLGYGVGLALLVSGAVWLADHPGAVQVEWLQWRLTTNVPFLLAGLLVLAGGLFFFIKALAAILFFPRNVLGKRRLRLRHKGYQALSDGLAAVASGQVKQARKLAGKAEKLLKDPSLTRFLSAQTAQLTGDEAGERQHYEAMRDRPETALLGWRGLLDLALKAGDRDQAIELAQGARRLAPADPALADQLFTLLTTCGRWAEAQDLVLEAGRRKAMSREVIARRRALILNERARRAEQDGDTKDALAFAKQAGTCDPDFADAALRLARLQAAQDLTRQAAATLEKAWRAQPLPILAEAFAALQPNEAPLQRLRRLEKLAAIHPDHWITHLVMGEAALNAKLWGQARKHLTTAAAERPTATLLGLLAKLEIGEYKNHKAAQSWMSQTPEPDPAWLCGDCGTAGKDWELLCPHCGAVDKMTWSQTSTAEVKQPLANSARTR